jgi:hypothetical protein
MMMTVTSIPTKLSAVHFGGNRNYVKSEFGLDRHGFFRWFILVLINEHAGRIKSLRVLIERFKLKFGPN